VTVSDPFRIFSFLMACGCQPSCSLGVLRSMTALEETATTPSQRQT
jgi:hypothetical protein